MEGMKDALKGKGGGLQETSGIVGDTMGNAMDMRGSKSKKADQASTDLQGMGKSAGPTVQSSINSEDQIKNQSTGTSDHIQLGMRKT